MVELDIYTELKQNMTKLYISDVVTLPKVREGFYEDMTKYLSDVDNEEASILFAKFKRNRIVKMTKNASALVGIDTFNGNLSPEEVVLYNELTSSIDRFWSAY